EDIIGRFFHLFKDIPEINSDDSKNNQLYTSEKYDGHNKLAPTREFSISRKRMKHINSVTETSYGRKNKSQIHRKIKWFYTESSNSCESKFHHFLQIITAFSGIPFSCGEVDGRLFIANPAR